MIGAEVDALRSDLQSRCGQRLFDLHPADGIFRVAIGTAVAIDCGIIAGDCSLNPLLSCMLTGPNDGKVTVASARLDGMRDFLVLHYSHTWLMWRKNTLRQIQCFLESGKFERNGPKA